MAVGSWQEFAYFMGEQQKNFEWKRRTDGPPWDVIDWRGNLHTFETEGEQLDFIERDRRMISNASREAHKDVTGQITAAFQNGSGVGSEDHGEEHADHSHRQVEALGAGVGGKGNRRSRRGHGGTPNRSKASRRRR